MDYTAKQLTRLKYLVSDEWVVPDHRQTHWNFHKALSEIESAAELHQYAANYNRDCGHDGLKDVIFHPLCDKGTLLLVYYFGRPDFYYKLEKQQRPFAGSQLDEFSFLKIIEDLVKMGSFNSETIRVDPADVGPRHINFLAKEGADMIPDFMKTPSEGSPLELLTVMTLK